jgi:uncharacterized protein with PhoU and TrkA domain
MVVILDSKESSSEYKKLEKRIDDLEKTIKLQKLDEKPAKED